MTKTQHLEACYPGIAVWPEFDDAILGISFNPVNDLPSVIYDLATILKFIKRESDMEDLLDASDWFEYNYTNSSGPYVAGSDGPHPILLDRLLGVELHHSNEDSDSE